MVKVKMVCEKCEREYIVISNESYMVQYQSGLKKLLRLECPYCHKAAWRKEENLRASGRLVYT